MWGPWAVGMAVRDSRISGRFQAAGLTMLQPDTGIQLLTRAVACLTLHSTLVTAQISWSKLLSAAKHVPQSFSELGLSTIRQAESRALSTPQALNTAEHDINGVQNRVRSIIAAMLGGNVSSDQVPHQAYNYL